MISLKELAIPMIGFPISSLINPNAFNNERCGALVAPLATLSLRTI